MSTDQNPELRNQEQESKQLLADLIVLSQLPSESVKQLGDRLEQHSGFVSVENLSTETFGDSEAAAAISRLLQGLVPASLSHVTAMVEYWRQSDGDAGKSMPDSQFATLKENLLLLVRHSPALMRTRKAVGLQRVTGNELMGVMFICDARPVYNNARDDIDGYVALATMKLVFQRQNSDTEEIELVLTPDEIDLLIDRAQKAKQKIDVMNTKLTSCLPNGIVGGGI